MPGTEGRLLAETTGLRVDDQQVDRAVQRVAHNNNMTMTQFRSALERDGIAYLPERIPGYAPEIQR